MDEGRGERATGTPNTIYNLSSVLFHALEGGANYDQYIRDAEEAGDRELAEFFRQARDEDSGRADEAQRLLAERTSTTTELVPTEGEAAPHIGLAAGAPRREETTGAVEGERDMAAAPIAPMSGPGRDDPDAPPRTEPTGARPGTEEARPRTEEPIARTEEATPPRPEPSRDLPGTEPIRDEEPPMRGGEVPPAPEEIPPERAGEIPTAEEVPPPRTAGVEEVGDLPRTEERPPGTEGTMPPITEEEASPRTEGDPPRTEEVSPRAEEAPLPEEHERARQAEREQEDKGLIDRVADAARDTLSGQEEPRREEPGTRGASREPRRDDPLTGRP